ncbi:MAG TPA: CHAT domain-containing protein, partial [Blastocatellia bacterium]
RAADIFGKKRWLIVSQGALQYIPFAALPVPETHTPLIADHEIISLPSASALVALSRNTKDRKPAARKLMILADPVFSADDSRIRQTRVTAAKGSGDSGSGAGSNSEVERSASESGFTGLRRLRFSRQEANAIAALAPAAERLEALDFSASQATATSSIISQYRIVHFATHGLINSLHPELSGIALSLVDERGQPQDGFLRLDEIYNLNLNADLVVLSACRTALGREIKGEGLVGLVRGFMYAGATRVVASLWSVDDRATAELMKRFYQKMLGKGLTPSAALRAAQLEMRREKGWEDPFFWSGFVFQGEWRSF